jgi:hypothetical protein
MTAMTEVDWVLLVRRHYAENYSKLLAYLDWFNDEELPAMLPTGYTVADNFTHVIATRCIVLNRFLQKPSPLPWELVKRFSRIFPPRLEAKENPPRDVLAWLLATTQRAISDGIGELGEAISSREVFDAKYRHLPLFEKLISQATHEAYHIGMIGGYRAVVVERRVNPSELRDCLAAAPCELSNQQDEDARILSEWM